ncbi:MAG: polysaccharide lyase 6 family protein [Candidatus Latescibacteria bacterium]|nr:polysaccharide lyase 6 family protein [Candidatus Latescibacterota bacterium]
MTDDRAAWVIIALAVALVVSPGLSTSAQATGLIQADGRTFRDVIASCFDRPFQTDADMRIYHTNTKGRVATDGEPVFFSYPGIQDVLVNGRSQPVVQRGPNRVRVRMAAGVHDVVISASSAGAAFDLPVGPDRDTGSVGDVDAFNKRAGELQPGDELVVKNGVYTGWATALIEAEGTPERPVVIRPQTPGGVIFRGRTHFRLSGRHIVFKGFRFDHAGPAHVLYVIGGENIRITQCQFASCGDAGRTYSHIVRITRNSHRNRVDHCYFTASKSISVGLRIIGADDLPTHNRIDHNIFRDIFRYWGNGQENIQLGGPSKCTVSEAKVYTLVDHCLFDNAWGDSETISNKSSNNSIRYNVAANCLYSGFTIRSGNDVRFEGNVMANSGGGVRVFGDRHIIANNLFLNLLDAGIALMPGSTNSRLRTAATNTLIAHNTFVECPVTAIGAERESPDSPIGVEGVTVLNNLITGGRGELVDLKAAAGVDTRRNLIWPTGHARIETGRSWPILYSKHRGWPCRRRKEAPLLTPLSRTS